MKRLITLSVIVMALCLTVVGIVKDGSRELSPHLSDGLSVLAAQSNMAKYALVGNNITFSADDFERSLNLESINSITVTSLPPAVDGCLCVGDVLVSVGQTVSSSNLDLLNFREGDGKVRETGFSFRVGEGEYEMTCELYFLTRENSAPTLETESERSLTVSTHRSVSVWGKLGAYDPDGDDLRYEITSYARGGVVELDAETGEYCYTPTDSYVGRDSFEYVAVDKYGNYSASRSVILTVEDRQTDLVLSDMQGHRAHHAALSLIEMGAMSATTVADTSCFFPDRTVTRLDFAVMLLRAAEIEPTQSTANTSFDDDGEIPDKMKPYVLEATRRGIMSGSVDSDGKYLFEPNREITRAEAALAISKIVGGSVPTVKPTFSDKNDIPTWASDAIYILADLGIMQSDGGAIAPLAPLTRAQAAQMLLSLSEYLDYLAN